MSSFSSSVDITELSLSLILLHLCGSVSPGKWGWRWDSLHMRSVRQMPTHAACVYTTGGPHTCWWPWLPPSAAGIFMALLNSRPLSWGVSLGRHGRQFFGNVLSGLSPWVQRSLETCWDPQPGWSQCLVRTGTKLPLLRYPSHWGRKEWDCSREHYSFESPSSESESTFDMR